MFHEFCTGFPSSVSRRTALGLEMLTTRNGLPTLRRAYSSQIDLVSVAEQGLLLEAPGGGLAGYDSGGVLVGSELIAPSLGNESPRGN